MVRQVYAAGIVGGLALLMAVGVLLDVAANRPLVVPQSAQVARQALPSLPDASPAQAPLHLVPLDRAHRIAACYQPPYNTSGMNGCLIRAAHGP